MNSLNGASYTKPSRKLVAGVHYRPMWAEELSGFQNRPKSERNLLQKAFPKLTPDAMRALELLFEAKGKIVISDLIFEGHHRRTAALYFIRKAGVGVQHVRIEKGFRLTPEGLEFVRNKLEQVRG